MIYLIKAKDGEGIEMLLESNKPFDMGCEIVTEENQVVRVMEVTAAPEDYLAGNRKQVKAELSEIPKWSLENRVSELEKKYQDLDRLVLIMGSIAAVFFVGIYLLFKQYLF